MSLLRLYMLVVIVTAGIGVGVILITSSKVESKANAAAEQSQASIQASELQAGLGAPIVIWSAGFWSIFQDPAFNALPPQQRGAVNAEIFRDFYDLGPAPPGLPPIQIQLTDRQLVDFQRTLDGQLKQIDELLAIAPPSIATSRLREYRNQLSERLEVYLSDTSLPNFRHVFALLIVTQATLGEISNQFSEGTAVAQAEVHSATNTARVLTLLALAVLTLTMAFATFYVMRLIQGAFGALETKTTTLSKTMTSLQHRNQQLSALYNVFAEITDTLSLRYVVEATLREARTVMGADMTVLRLLRGNELVVAGAVRADGSAIDVLPPVNLGEGPTGRTAKRGRTMRIDSNAQEIMNTAPVANGEPPRPKQGEMESGVIAPLIVGARVVGTIACWSRIPNAYTAEDEQVLEMMASQVATAVAAADATDRSERRAHQDALTGLPNRRQLNEDLSGDVQALARDGRRAIIAMADIDNFKRLNDDYGHKVGDVTLQKIGATLRSSVRDKDRVYRYGGEEFVLIFLDTNPEEGIMLAERVRTTLEQTPFSDDQLEPVGPITISIGLAALPDHGTDLDALIVLADAAMYQAKETGRNRVALWNDDVPLADPTSRTSATHAA